MLDIIGLLFWLLILLILWPEIQYKSLLSVRLSLIKKLEQKFNVRVITMIHRQEKIGFFKIPSEVYALMDLYP